AAREDGHLVAAQPTGLVFPPNGYSLSLLSLIAVGQCGNQIGCCFWDLALREHAAVNQKGIYDEAISSFFRNVDTRARQQVSF
uniref:Tubulin epsilon 1 n=1 Tax=Lynx canadensis TaxID=61383 RepID=A0A667GRP6_LYNCA